MNILHNFIDNNNKTFVFYLHNLYTIEQYNEIREWYYLKKKFFLYLKLYIIFINNKWIVLKICYKY